jgi:hypothetical protein
MEQSPGINGLVARVEAKLGCQPECLDNLLAFLGSCYAGHEARYNQAEALDSLAKLTDAEQSALIARVLLESEFPADDEAIDEDILWDFDD